MLICAWPQCENEVEATHPHALYCGKRCKAKAAVNRRRRQLKEKAVEYLGGECQRCGYKKCIWALEFHHRDPSTKEFGVGGHGHTRSWEKLKAELDKCDLLCANCHREVECDA